MLDGSGFDLETFSYESNNNYNTDGDACGIGNGGMNLMMYLVEFMILARLCLVAARD